MDATESNSRADVSAPADKVLDRIVLELGYIPDFLLDDLRFYFVPTLATCREVYHELTGKSDEQWGAYYYTKKGWSFVQGGAEGEGPYRVRPGAIELEILDPGRLFAPKPRLRLEANGKELPIVSLEKRRPINPWKPQYLRSIQFIKKYEWPHPLPRRVHTAIWEIEECGEMPGTVSWMNAERLLIRSGQSEDSDANALRETLQDIFFHRPEDYPLGSQIYLRVLGQLGDDGFSRLLELARHPITRKRLAVAKALGEPTAGSALPPEEARRQRLSGLWVLLDDEDPNVREASLRSIARIGLRAEDDITPIAPYLESGETKHLVWAAQALSGRSPEHRKLLLQLVKEDPRPLTDLGDLGELIVENRVVEAVPYLIQRLKNDDRQVVIDAADVLQRLSGFEIEVSAEGADEQKRLAVKHYQRWWEELKKQRRLDRKHEDDGADDDEI
jgi:hypothetical protein